MDELIVYPGTSEIHAETFARALGCEVRKDFTPSQRALFVGISPQLKPLVNQCRENDVQTIAYWIGSDSLCALRDPAYRRGIPVFDLHLCVHERIQKELGAWAVSSHVVYPCARNFNVTP